MGGEKREVTAYFHVQTDPGIYYRLITKVYKLLYFITKSYYWESRKTRPKGNRKGDKHQ